MIYLQQALIFLISTLVQLYCLVVLLRFLFQCFHINFSHPLAQFVFRVTNPPLHLFQKVLPRTGRFDIASLVLIVFLKAFELSSITLITHGVLPPALALMVWPLGELISQSINFFFFATLIVVVLNWINPSSHTPTTVILAQITEPLMSPIRRRMPALGIDLSPMLLLLGLKMLDILLARPITHLGTQLSLG